eukprot:scaffold264557_cov29-Attheya_sp.AAC.2
MFQGWSNVPADFAMWGPGSSVFRLVMGHSFCAWRCNHWGGIVIEFARDVTMSRYLGMEAALSQHVEGISCLLESGKLVSTVHKLARK